MSCAIDELEIKQALDKVSIINKIETFFSFCK